MTNRISARRVSAESARSTARAAAKMANGLYSTVKTPAQYRMAFFVPVHYEPNYAYPLVVWLHGPGDNEGQLKRVMPHISLRNYIATSVCGTAPYTSAGGKSGFAWAQTQPHVALAEQRAFDAIAAAQSRFNVSPRRIFVAGFDCGGTMALRLALNHPRRFAGVLSLGGEFPVGGAPLAALADARRVPIFLACGRDSQRYPAAVVCENLKLLHSAGMDLMLRQYPSGHDVSPQMLADMDRWIMSLVTGGSAPRAMGCIGEG
jgi:phospholipase/carboxylesterase